ncbi:MULTISPECIES: mannose-1-phosphate guanylyltransferase/mannose-6-phosphate isomerase [Paraburkholderia]|uniref:mannose-1-phosphate guanylyltransferase/mannose-6-phosphate isomerase n=1 Tax=Paraburkholderia TaxID=1822464 RepID=UPI000AC7DA35|nr:MULTISPECIES: mannose-1-phosphate guanylyltransferase/mannose-6-phosphate isomerase [Paraburkholderia]WEY41682.1 mannose-1-phosphate guanylyltransferase/mannose-6-phosphate isomerase [Paraburkholderia sp. SUR17]
MSTELVPQAARQTSTAPHTTLVVQPVILAGGAGTRLWPLSREQYPKQLIELLGEESLLAATARRLDGLETSWTVSDELLLVCGESHRHISASQLDECGKCARIVLEPCARNTAPALTAAALVAEAKGEDAILVVMPADHAVPNAAAFQEAVSRAARYAANGAVATIGVLPRHAEPGYGYIRVGMSIGADGGYTIERFVEKPHRELAEQYVRSGEYWWNSGIFVVRASVWLKAIETLCPDIHAACVAAHRNATSNGRFVQLHPEDFARCRNDSIDYSVMERLAECGNLPGVVVPMDAPWSDVGSWDSIWEIMPKDAAGNVSRGRVMFEDTTNTFAHSQGRLVACVGLRDVVVVETPDAVLVADRRNAQQIRNIVSRLRAERGPEADNHRKVHRPWGYYDSLDSGERFQVKRIVVKPGESLSLQMHHHRAEHWVVVRGTAQVTCGEKTFLLTENQSTYIPLGTVHRLSNPGKTPLEIIEVQSGTYLGEDDIVRFDDNYGRLDKAAATQSSTLPAQGAPQMQAQAHVQQQQQGRKNPRIRVGRNVKTS